MLQSLDYKCTADLINTAYDVACLDINSESKFHLSALNLECHNCIFVELEPNQKSYLFDTKYEYILKIRNNETICSQTVSFAEHAMYGWNFTGNNCSDIFLTKPASENPYIPIVGAVIFFILFGCLWYHFKCMRQCLQRRGSIILSYFKLTSRASNLTTPSTSLPLVVEKSPKREHSNRVRSIDVFRGFCIVVMIFFHYGGGEYWFFQHALWNGLHITDCLFPWFLWIVGFCIKISIRIRVRNSIPRRHIIIQIIKRSVILIVLGIVVNSHNSYSKLNELRFLGELQRIAVCYLIVALLEVFFSEDSSIDDTRSSITISCFEDFKNSWPQWIVVLSLVTLHTLITFLLPVPGCPTGYLGPGGLQNYPHYENCTGGAAGYIDRLIFGTNLQRKSIAYWYTMSFDDNGLLGTLTSVLTVYMGVQAARILHTYDALSSKVVRWVVWATVTGIIAGLLCDFSKNGGIIPVNKKIYSLSFAFAVSSFAFLIECALYVLVDVTKKWDGRPLMYPGMNSILLYVGHIMCYGTFPFYWSPVNRTHQNFLIINLCGTCVWVIISCLLYKKNIFLKI